MKISELYELYDLMLKENFDSEIIDELVEIISEKESKLFEFTSATGGPVGSSGATLMGMGGNSVNMTGANYVNANRGAIDPVPSSNPSKASGNLTGTNWINGGGKSGGDLDVPYNPSGSNRVFQKIPAPMGKGHGARTGKKSRLKGLDLKALRDMLKNKRNNTTDMKPKEKKVLNFDDFQKDKFSQVTKVKEGKTFKSFKEKDTDVKKENFRTEIRNLIKSLEDFSIKQIGNDLSINKGDDEVLQVMFRDDYVGVKKVSNKFPKEFKYNELGKIKSEIKDILK